MAQDIEGSDDEIEPLNTVKLPINSSQFGKMIFAISNRELVADIDVLTTLLAENISQLSNISRRLSTARLSTRQALLSRLEVARTFIAEAKDSHITLSNIERESCLSRFHLIRLFTQVYGTSPMRYHQNIKLGHARTLLKTGMPQKEVAEKLGFSTVSSFSRAYRRCIGKPPSSHS